MPKTYRRPVKPIIPYPHEAIQHTRATLALTMITLSVSLLKPAALKNCSGLAKQVEKVERLLDKCGDDIQGRKLSAGAHRDLDAKFNILAVYVGAVQTADGDANRWAQWSAGLYASLIFLTDARSTCPRYFKGRSWYGLYRELEILVDQLETVDPQVAELGTEIYMQAA